ncbi:MAG: DUF4331 family protein [Bdellovibrionales bacterium]|nr:DUF4331 family protein [Bdellovibrionales bacterium]
MKMKTACAAFASVLLILTVALAADHNEAPGIMGAEQSFFDITDVFAFKSPNDPGRLVLVIGAFSPVAATTPPLFSNDGRYELYVDTNDDFVSDATIVTEFETQDGGVQTFRMRGVPGAGTITGTVSLGSDANVASSGDALGFAGLRDDHFFFDANAFRAFTASPCVPTAGLRCPGTGDPTNFFGAFNTATIVVEFPITALPGISAADQGVIHVWGKTFEGM